MWPAYCVFITSFHNGKKETLSYFIPATAAAQMSSFAASYSPNAAAIIQSCGSHRTSEHLTLRLLTSSTDLVSFLRQDLHFPVDEAVAKLQALPWMNSQPTSSATFERILETASKRAVSREAGRETFHEIVTKTDPVATEELFLAVLMQPRAIGRYILEDAAESSSIDLRRRVAAGMGRHMEECRFISNSLRDFVARQDGQSKAWTETLINGTTSPSTTAATETDLRLPGLRNPSLRAIVSGPTPESNWLIPGKVMVGECPGGWDRDPTGDVQAILREGVNTFVSLLEYAPEYLGAIQKTVQAGTPPNITISSISFPIDDFSIADVEQTTAFVEELARRIQTSDSVMYIHCFSGRGRTGTIAIPLLMAIFPQMTRAEATEACNAYKSNGRTGRTRGGHMPEIQSQVEQVERNEVPCKRGGHKAGHKY
jgi:hypothetical protein